ncbi:hypothetical protein G6F57_015796 [Rhizopus arrhizus]|nr:hypothetical protein G6F57_015796 [Rhizopus arrhizus]
MSLHPVSRDVVVRRTDPNGKRPPVITQHLAWDPAEFLASQVKQYDTDAKPEEQERTLIMTTQTTTVQGLRTAPEAQMPIVAPGFGSLQGFELMQRAARLLSSSTLVPVAYRQTIEKLDRFGNVKESRENPNALANSVVALNMAQRMGADPLMVMQNLYIVEGRPSWSSQWIIAAINGCGRFSPLRFRIESRGEREIEHKSTYWENNQRHTKVEKVKINDKVCVAWAIEKETGEVIESPAVSIEMAVLEGWYTKNGSKWQTMDEVMLRYRTASFFGKLYAPELLMGLQTVEEAQDIIEATTSPDAPAPRVGRRRHRR